eukprot:CAMPEP_0174885622 /NCGR_PEP_ID=MMETSP0167-20121228/880_1 /TAXON_ID=38298 /ORGANISM="Rhodella maculata, Strain CCMP736" /LENGTH=105 /DNA_ID=CAMNT_0016121257 /DNA_START=20 /DNA_END=337 /DNA_ORIENTATION=+
MPVAYVKSKSEFDAVIASNPRVVVDFTATWCGPCKAIAPLFEQFSTEFDSVKFIKVDVDDVKEVAAAAGITAMPTFHFYKDGKKAAELVGANKEQLKALISKNAA